jgi:hypothetical protein
MPILEYHAYVFFTYRIVSFVGRKHENDAFFIKVIYTDYHGINISI